MPLTMAHPLAVVPLRRTRLIFPALVIGAMVPDLPHFIPTPWIYVYSHALIGVVTVDVAAALAVLWLWERVLFPAYDAVVPTAWKRWAEPGARRSLRWWCYAAPSAAIGAWTHVAWDVFTHDTSFLAQEGGPLTVQLGPAPVYTWLQYGSSVVGAAALAVWCARRWRASRVVRRDAAPLVFDTETDRALLVWAPVTVGLVMAAWRVLVVAIAGASGFRAYIFGGVTWATTGAAATALLMAAGWRLAVEARRR
ncbi:DUF4184 family protein [Falsarthrobacter nasiphocae]|uniref:DUF4184 family protein n=1 Tax=Falsarthrobacter nasiphocae TaxID=189863 RepID=A0AAE4C4P6_9MICC|nr:DUF4184 family protein [Falsarthrobacter nasiphocae]MDR6891561.1 hypothetical protein [Falsarthrobacter nasiphocae]